MSKTLKITLIVVAVLFGAAILVTGGVVLGRVFSFRSAVVNNRFNDSRQSFGMGPDMMGQGSFKQRNDNRESFRPCPGMMGRGFFNGTYTGEPASIEEAQSAFDIYLTNLGNDDLEINEIMIFNQNAYAVVSEKSTNNGALELLLDYASGEVYPEMGPNHMWNLKYGIMAEGQNRALGCRMGCNAGPETVVVTEMTVTEVDAKTAAQAYLDANDPGATASDEGMVFYGYYTFDYSVAGKIAGMLSVNGYSSQVWPHTWHGQFVDEWELE